MNHTSTDSMCCISAASLTCFVPRGERVVQVSENFLTRRKRTVIVAENARYQLLDITHCCPGLLVAILTWPLYKQSPSYSKMPVLTRGAS